MNASFNLDRVYPHHDLLIEIGLIELAMDRAAESCNDGNVRSPELELRMLDLCAELDRLDA